jgi:hypothetical protein
MKDLLEKISSYNLFTYFLPGTLFVFIAKKFIGYDFIQENVLLGAFLYYFIGMVISRIGSLFIDPILNKISFLKFADYKDFIAAEKKDSKIELLSEVNNTYRSISALFICLLILNGYNYFKANLRIPDKVSVLICVILVLIIFLLSYRKQTGYITKRIEAANKT